MRKIALFLIVGILIAGFVQAQPEYPLLPVADYGVSQGESRCGDFFIFTPNTPDGPSVMFQYSANGRNVLKVVALQFVTVTLSATATAPTVTITSSGNTISSAKFRVAQKEARNIENCFPSPAQVLPSTG